MNTLTRKRHTSDRGASMVEILVTVFLLAIVGTVIAGTVIAAMKTTRSTQSGVEGQSELNDALSRIARDVAAADPILATTTSWGTGVGASPSATELWTQSVVRYKCVRTRYWLDTTGTTKALKSSTQTFTGETCPDPTTAVTTPAPVVKTIIKDFKTTDTSGATVPLFTYYDKANSTIAAPIARVNVAKIARVKIDVGSNVRERTNGVRLSTSATPRTLNGSLVTGIPAPVCNTYVSSDGGATIVGADLNGRQDTAYVTTPIVNWKTADYGDTYVLRRGNTSTTGAFNGTWTTLGTYTSGQTITDSAMRGRYGRDLKYEIDITGPGGSVTCGVDVARIANKPPAAPTLTISLTPDTRNGPHTADFTQSDAQMSWTRSAEAENYQFYNRPIDANTSPYNATGAGAWTAWNWPYNDPTTTATAGMSFDTAYEWHLVAVDMDWYGPDGTRGVSSLPSNTGKTLAHNNAPLIGNVVANNAGANQTGPATYNQNRISWPTVPGDSTIDGYRVWKRPTGTTTWAAASAKLPASTRTFLDTGVALDSQYDYTVTAYNDGPRGTGTNAATITYYGRYSNIVTILQYPSIPVATAHGTEYNPATNAQWNPDGRNSIQWNPVPNATNYEIWEYANQAQAASGYGTWVFYGVGTSTLRYDSNGQNGGAIVPGSRDFYAVIAQNATGFSENHNTPNGPALRAANGSTAYQRPPTPPMTWNAAPNLNVDPTLGNATVFNYTRNADSGEDTNDTFCADPTLCTYYAYKGNTLQETETGNTGDGVIGAMGQTAWWGSTDTWGVYSCNPGGCSDPNSVGVNYYPGPFTPKIANFGDLRTLDQWGKGGSYNRTWTGDAGANYNWTRSYGASSWSISRTPVADDAFNYPGSQWYNQSGPYNQFAPGWTRTDTTNTTGTNQQLENADGTPVRVYGTPGSVQRFAVSAIAPNGLSRYEFLDYQQKAAPVKFAETARSCNGGNATMWRLAGRLQPQAALYDGVTGNVRNTYTDHFRVTTVAGRQSGTGGAFTQLAADLENNSVSGTLKGDPSATNGGTFNDGAWNLDGNQDVFWMHEGFVNGSTGTAVYPGGIFSNSSASWNIPRQSYVGGAMRITPILQATGAHAVGYGDFNGISVSLNEFVVNDQSFACSQSGNWLPELDSISRSGVIGGGSTIAPSGAGRTFGLSGN